MGGTSKYGNEHQRRPKNLATLSYPVVPNATSIDDEGGSSNENRNTDNGS
jgi:hypothetical protein